MNANTKSARSVDVRKLAKILRDGSYSYDQSKHLIAEARRAVGLTPPKRKRGSVSRLNALELDRLLKAAYASSGVHGLMVRTLLETGSRVAAFTRLRVDDIAWDEMEVRVHDKGDKVRDVPLLMSLVEQLRIHLDGRSTGYLFPSPRGGAYSSRRVQQMIKSIADAAGITKNVYPHLLRHTIAQHLADNGMPENLLQKFLGHDNPQTTQIYYEAARNQVNAAFRKAMNAST